METKCTDTQTDQYSVSWEEIYIQIRKVWIEFCMNQKVDTSKNFNKVFLWGVPRGGTYVAMAWKIVLGERITLVDSPEKADIIVDDIIDSGETKERYKKYGKPFVALYTPMNRPVFDGEQGEYCPWLIFPWEQQNQETGPEDNIVRSIQYIGEDPNREGLLETPKRVVKSWDCLYGGYKQKEEDIYKIFEEDSSDEMVVLKNIEFYSTCEHHMLPFYGKAHIAYIPNEKVIGVSKLARLLDMYARRLQIQERICKQVTFSIMKNLKPHGCACILEAQHFCMTSRGVQKQNSIMVTSSLEGVFRNLDTRTEFMNFIK